MAQLRHTTYGDTADVFNVDDDDEHWHAVAQHLGGFVIDDAYATLARVLEIVRSRGCATVVFERRYLDADYRSEYSAFWSGRFEGKPPHAARAHFFEKVFDATALPALPENPGYLGYCVIRPTELGAVGRTVIAPPKDVDVARLARVVERPSLFGHPLEVSGVPFCQQDGELLRCAHAAAWVCHYVAFHQRIIARRLTADIASLPSVEGSKHRPLPSTGLTGEQLQGVFSAIGIPAFFYEVDWLPRLPADMPDRDGESDSEHDARVRDERIFRVVCKYLNSGFPVVVLTEGQRGNHAFTLVGWQKTRTGGVRLIACDDRVGPYETIESPTLDDAQRGKWKGLMMPLPGRVYLTGEAAENRARQIVSAEYDQASLEEDGVVSDFSDIAPHLGTLAGPISVRARLIEGRRYKAIAGRQGRHPEAVRVARMAHLPHWVWVVEFQDRACRAAEEPCVVAEVVFDSTSHDERPSVDLISTKSIIIDTNMPDDEDDGEGASEHRIWMGQLDGAKWRSMISDPGVGDTEYPTVEPPPPGSVSAAG